MKINPIISVTNTFTSKKLKQKENVTNPQKTNLTSSKAYYGQDLVVFKGQIPPTEKSLKALRIGKLLSGAMTKLQTGDVLVFGKSMDVMKKAMEEFVPDFTLPIKNLGFCISKDVDETFLLLKGMGDESKLWSLSEDVIRINGIWGVEKFDSMWLEEGDHIGLGGTWVQLTNNGEDVEYLNDDNFKYFRCVEQLNEFSKNYNKKLVANIFKQNKTENVKKNFSFDKIGGQDEVIKSLKRNILFPLKHPEAFEGFMMNRGAVLYGPPGTGKTLIAKTLGVESNASVFEMCATDMQDKYVGESEKNCRELFKKAVDAQPSIIYLDEFEALGKSRGGQDVHGDKLLSQFLSLMSDLEKNNDRVYVIAATNRIEDIDPAILRSGRFALKLEVKQPDLAGTRQILDIHSKGKPMDEKLDYDSIAQKMFAKKMSGADIAVTVKEAASNAFEREGIYKSMEEGRYTPEMLEYFRITAEDFDKAIDSFSSGAKQRNPIGFGK